MRCADCDSENVVIVIEEGTMTKDFVSKNVGPFGIPEGQEVPLEKIVEYIHNEDYGISFGAIVKCQDCDEQCDVDIEMEDGKQYDHNDEYRTIDGNYLFTIEACLFDIAGVKKYV